MRLMWLRVTVLGRDDEERMGGSFSAVFFFKSAYIQVWNIGGWFWGSDDEFKRRMVNSLLRIVVERVVAMQFLRDACFGFWTFGWPRCARISLKNTITSKKANCIFFSWSISLIVFAVCWILLGNWLIFIYLSRRLIPVRRCRVMIYSELWSLFQSKNTRFAFQLNNGNWDLYLQLESATFEIESMKWRWQVGFSPTFLPKLRLLKRRW